MAISLASAFIISAFFGPDDLCRDLTKQVVGLREDTEDSLESKSVVSRISYEMGPWLFRLWDINQKYIFLLNNILIAAPQNFNAAEQIIEVLPNNALKQNMHPIFMGISDKRVLSCVKSFGSPKLQLVAKNIMDLYNEGDAHENLSFYVKSEGGPNTFAFESAGCPGWFLSTSPHPGKPLGLSQQGGAWITSFYFQRMKLHASLREAVFKKK